MRKPAQCCKGWPQLLLACRAVLCMRGRRVLRCEKGWLLGIARATLCPRPQPAAEAAVYSFGILVAGMLMYNDG